MDTEQLIEKLVLWIKEKVTTAGCRGTVIGLSGGIDSAFTAYICAEALGPDKITCIMMPTRFTSQDSLDLAKKLCDNTGMNYVIHPIDDIFQMQFSS